MGLQPPSSRPTKFSALEVAGADNTALAEGYFVTAFQAAAALNYGDAVFVDTNGKVDKSTTNADYLNFVGIVVGGDVVDGEVLFGSSAVGSKVAEADDLVLIALPGSIVHGVVGAAGVTPGIRVSIDAATAGRVRAQAASSTAYTIATGLATQASAGSSVLLLVQSPVSVTLA